MKIFISYSTRDGSINSQKLRRFIKTLPSEASAFVDILHNDSENVQARIEYEIASCDLFLGLISPAFYQSPWVKFELETAKNFRRQVSFIDTTSLVTFNSQTELVSYCKILKDVQCSPQYRTTASVAA